MIKDQCEEEIKILEDKFYVDEKQTNRVLLTASYLSEQLLNNEQDIKILLWATRLLEIGKSINLKIIKSIQAISLVTANYMVLPTKKRSDYPH